MNEGIKLRGMFELIHKNSKGEVLYSFQKENTIQAGLKDMLKDALDATESLTGKRIDNTSFMATSARIDNNTPGDGKDGIIVATAGDVCYGTATVEHPSDFEGNYYFQWQGVWTNGTGGSVSITQASLGVDWDNSIVSGINGWDNGAYYASQSFAAVAVADGDTLTINWKISIS